MGAPIMPDENEVLRMAALAAAGGGVARLLMAMHGGQRNFGALVIEAGLGATLGLMTAAAALWWDPGLRDAGWPFLIVTGAAGGAGAVGLRMLDLVMDALKKRLG
jgi:hypothetical protein